MKHFYRDVPHLGCVALSRHAQSEAEEDNIPDATVEDVLMRPSQPDIPDGQNIVWREKNGVRLVIILKPTPGRGARLVKTIYRVQPQARLRP
jgi:hypothetical protein